MAAKKADRMDHLPDESFAPPPGDPVLDALALEYAEERDTR